MADDFASATRSAAAGGNTTVLPFALQRRAIAARLRRGLPEARRRRVLHRHVLPPHHLRPDRGVLGQELPALVKDGYTSFKVFMTYDDLVLSDKQLLEVFEVARASRRS